MDNLNMIVEFLIVTVSAGLIGTTGMTLFMFSLTRFGVTNADMVRAVGSLFTKSMQTAGLVGTYVHYTSGVIFAVLYSLAFGFFDVHGTLKTIIAGFGIGFMHGFVLSFLLIIAVAEHHPLEEFRQAGFSVAIAHFVGHIIFGILVGAVIGFAGIQAF